MLPSNLKLDSIFESYLRTLHKQKTKLPSLYVYGFLHALDLLDLSSSRIQKFRLALNKDSLSTTTELLSAWYKLTSIQ